MKVFCLVSDSEIIDILIEKEIGLVSFVSTCCDDIISVAVLL